MCIDPMTALAAATTIGGGALSAGGQLMAGRSTASSARMAAWMAQRNAEMELQRGSFEESRVRDRTDATLAGQTASVTARDIDPAYGSPLVIQGLSAAQGETDALLTRAGGIQSSAQQLWSAAGSLGKAQDARRGALLGAAGTLLSSVSPWALKAMPGGGSAGGGTRAAGAVIGGTASDWWRF